MFKQQLSSLLHKNWLVQRRRWIWTLAELFLPLALTGTLVAVNFLVTKEQFTNRIYDPIQIRGDFRDLSSTMVDGFTMTGYTFSPSEIYFAPNTSFINRIMSKLKHKLAPVQFWNDKDGTRCRSYDGIPKTQDGLSSTEFSTFATLEGFDTPEDLESALYQKLLSYYPSTFYAGIVFSDDFANEKNLKNVHYQLRFTYEQRNIRSDISVGSLVFTWSTDKDFNEDFNNLNSHPNSSDGGIPSYWREGFLTLQRALDMVIIQTMVPDSLCTLLNTTVSIQRYPFPGHVKHPLIGLLPLLLPAVLVLSFALSALYITRSLTVEKETKLVEYVCIITGLKPWVQSLAHFIVIFVKLFIIVFIITVMLSVSIFQNSNGFLIGLLLFLYMLNVISFSFTVASFFNTVNSATLCSGVLWFLLYIPCFYLQSKFSTLQRHEILSFMILPNAAIVVFSQIISSLESQGVGLRWNNFFIAPFSKSKFAIYESYLMLCASILPPLAIRLLYELCQMLWTSDMLWSTTSKRSLQDPSHPIQFDAKRVEPNSSDTMSSISIEKAFKTFTNGRSSPTKALNNLSMNIYPGELTVILGHNGAGKSTLMNVLTGITHLTTGAAFIQSFDVCCQMNKIRQMIGYCPQYNILFNEMTVLEHLKFFSRLRGIGYDIDKSRWLMQKLGLVDKRHDFARHLSGGQKRRLCLAIALINKAKIVLLDEATSGMDPSAKGDILDVIKREKRFDRTFVLVTHYVDEADTLGDRVAILSNGKLQCNGSNMFLKNRFGSGYRLTLKFKHLIEQNLQLFVDKILEIIQEHCPGSSLIQFCGSEAKYLLNPPNMVSVVDSSSLRTLLGAIESLQARLPIDSMSLSMPTMHDVFMNTYNSEKMSENYGTNKDEFNSPILLKSESSNSGVSLLIQQLWTTFCKRARYACRKRLLLLTQCVVLIVTVGGSLILNKILNGYKPKPPPKKMMLNAFSGTNFLLATDLKEQNNTVRLQLENLLTNQNLHIIYPSLRSLNMSGYVLEQSSKLGLMEFMESSYMGLIMERSASGETSNVLGFFNNWATHSPSVVLNLINNAILKTFCHNCSISADNYPLPQTTVLYYSFGEDFVLVLCLAVGLAFFLTNFASTLVEERTNGAKHMQLLAGLHPAVYWLGTMMWDLPFYFAASLCIVLMWLIGGCDLLIDNGAWLDMVLLLTLHGWAILPFIYVFSFVFSSPTGAVTMLTAVNLLLNLVPTLTVTTLSVLSINDVSLQDTEKWITNVCSIFLPQFTLSKAVITYYSNRLMRKQCDAMKACDYLEQINSEHFKITKNSLQWLSPGVGRYLTCLSAQGCVFLILLIIIEWYTVAFRRSTSLSKLCSVEPLPNESAPPYKPKPCSQQNGYVLDVQELQVQYPGQSRPAVQNLSFRISRGEIFGLNGENGSGKTTTYKILTGQLCPNGGSVHINGTDVVKDWRKAASFIGFCPQVDALLELLTAMECLYHFARIKGIPECDIEDISVSLINAVGLKLYANRVVKTFSGGNKRKLSLAISILGAPPLILLDEPTCGVDPKARRSIWKVLNIVRKLGCAIVLTSHDMEECEALCNRLMIMVRGQSKCTGSPQALVDQHATAYNLRLTVDPETDIDEFQKVVKKLFRSSELIAQPNQCQFHFAVPMIVNSSWSNMFKNIETLQKSFDITDFALSQPTLQEAFVSMTRKSNST